MMFRRHTPDPVTPKPAEPVPAAPAVPTTIEDASHRQAAAATCFRPATVKELRLIMQRFARSQSLLTVVGGRTGLTGGCVPAYGGDALDMSRLLRVQRRWGYRSISFKNGDQSGNFLLSWRRPRTGIFPSGITLQAMDDCLAKHHLFFASKPGYLQGELGGAVATNASGPRTLALGTTRDNVLGLKVILPNGQPLSLKRRGHHPAGAFSLPGIQQPLSYPVYTSPAIKNVVGFYGGPDQSPLDLFVGSEGTLGVFSEVSVRLFKRRPIQTLLVFFASVPEAFGFADSLRSMIYQPAARNLAGILALEYMDANALSLVPELLAAKNFDPAQLAAAIEIEYFEEHKATRQAIDSAGKQNRAIHVETDGEFVRQLRYAIPQAVNAIMGQRGLVKIASDVAVPAANFNDMYTAYRQADQTMTQATGQPVASATWGHLGNYHLHWNALPNSDDSYKIGVRTYQTLAAKALALGGTLSAEHGMGKKQIFHDEPMLATMDPAMYSYAVQLIGAVNPDFRLNRGNIVGYPVPKLT